MPITRVGSSTKFNRDIFKDYIQPIVIDDENYFAFDMECPLPDSPKVSIDVLRWKVYGSKNTETMLWDIVGKVIDPTNELPEVVTIETTIEATSVSRNGINWFQTQLDKLMECSLV